MFDEVDDMMTDDTMWSEASGIAEEYEAKVLGKRKRNDLDDDFMEGVDESKRTTVKENAVHVMAWRWSWSSKLGLTEEEFKARQPSIDCALKAQVGKKGKFVYQLEKTGDTNLHYQGYVNVDTKIRPLTLGGRLGVQFPGIYVAPASDAGREALRRYCMKAETRVAGPWADKPLAKEYTGKDLPLGRWRPWQQRIIDEVSVECTDDRTINWIYDEQGNVGKSKLVKYLTWKNLALPMTLCDVKDGAHMVVKEGERPSYFFDIPRTKTKKVSMDEMYSLVESIKNGVVISPKYDGGKLIMDPPHVWVMSNWKPDVTKMTDGRFKVFTVNRADWSLGPFRTAMEQAADELARQAPTSSATAGGTT